MSNTNAKYFSMTAFQDALIEKLSYIDANGVGEHKSRSSSRARLNARKALEGKGYSEDEARQAVSEAYDVYELQRVSE